MKWALKQHSRLLWLLQKPNQWQPQINLFVFISSGSVCRAGSLLLRQPSHLTVVTSADWAHSCMSQGHKFPLQLPLMCLSSTKTPVTSRLPPHTHTDSVSAKLRHKYWSFWIIDKQELSAWFFFNCLPWGKRTQGEKRACANYRVTEILRVSERAVVQSYISVMEWLV